jgi:hypothetical protein
VEVDLNVYRNRIGLLRTNWSEESWETKKKWGELDEYLVFLCFNSNDVCYWR